MKPTHSRRRTDADIQSELASVLERDGKELARLEEEYAARWPQAKRLQAVKEGNAMPGGHFPIETQEDLNSAARLVGRTKLSRSAVMTHIKKMAKKHSLSLPASWGGGAPATA